MVHWKAVKNLNTLIVGDWIMWKNGYKHNPNYCTLGIMVFESSVLVLRDDFPTINLRYIVGRNYPLNPDYFANVKVLKRK